MPNQKNDIYQITNGVLTASVIAFGASLTDLRLKGIENSLVLGYTDAQSYEVDHQFMGAVLGRYANRIANGRVSDIDNGIQLELNENQKHHLHGGSNAPGQRHWNLVERNQSKVVFEIFCEDQVCGYPGNMNIRATYEIRDASTLRLSIVASSDQKTPVNICHHPYFNFDGTDNLNAHQLQIMTDRYLLSDAELIPTGEIGNTQNSDFEFTTLRSLPHADFNNTYCLHDHQSGELKLAAKVSSPKVAMSLFTTQPGVHFYNGYKLRESFAGHNGKNYGPNSGLCLEAQAWPDSPNRSNFPDVSIDKDKDYRQVTDYKFETLA